MATPISTRLSHPLLRLILFFVLTLAVSLPANALAAPAGQGTGTTDAVLLAQYESDEIPTESGDSALAVLYLYDDNTFELEVDLQDGEDPMIGYGEYEETDDGVLLTLIGVDGEDFDESLEAELSLDADGTLVVPGSPDGLLGEEDVVLYPVDVETSDDTQDDTGDDTGDDTEDDTGDDTEDDTGDSTADDLTSAVGGAYISTIVTDDSGENDIYLINLLPDGQASFSVDYLNLEPPAFGLGTWTDNGDGTLTVEITRSVEEEYDEPIVLELTVGDFGELIATDAVLYPLSILDTIDAGETFDDSSEEDGTDTGEESEVIVYAAEIVFAGEEDPIIVYMWVYNDGTVILADEEQTGTLYGEWSADTEDETITMSFTSDDETDLDEPVELVFEVDEEGSLVATEYPVDVFGEDGLTFYLAEEGEDIGVDEGDSDDELTYYYYESEQLSSEDTDGIIVSLFLSEDQYASLSFDYLDGEFPSSDYGEWERGDAGTLTVTFTEGPEGALDEPYTLSFEENADDSSLTLVEGSIDALGDEELVLYLVE